MKPTSLIEALQDTDMLEVDGLYAWQFDLDTELLAQISAGTAGSDSADKPLLQVHCIDGRERRLWKFSLAAVQAARYDEESDSWHIEGNEVSHTLKCFAAFRGDNDDDDDV
ncbi:DUF5629 family protein [Pseudomonas sp. SH1-B]